MKRTATCACGQLRVTATGEPVRISICHCLDCQRRSGSAFSFQARWKTEELAVEGEFRTYVRPDEDAEADAEPARFNFCGDCGSTVFYTIGALPGLTAVAVGAFADPGFPAPKFSVFENRKHAWIGLPEAGIEHD